MGHHATIKMDLRLRFKKDYFTKHPKETGIHIQYITKQARKQRELLEQHMRDKQIHSTYDPNKTITENWTNIMATLHENVNHVYPNIQQGKTDMGTKRIRTRH